MTRFGMKVGSLGTQIGTDSMFKHRRYDETGIDDSSAVIRVDHNNCILCDRCVRGCSEIKPFKVIGHTGFGNKARVSFDLGLPMAESGCVSCGECAVSCPTGALTFKSSIYQERDPWVDEALKPETVPAEELEKLPLFAGVPYAFLKWNEGAVGRVNAQTGQVLCRQHDYGSTAFIMEGGSLDVVVGDKVVSNLDIRAVIVGELACLSNQARTATLQAGARGARVLVVKRNMLHMLQRNPGARTILAPIYRRRALDNYLQKGQLFAGLSDEQSAACIKFLKDSEDVSITQVDPGQAVFLEGNKADSFYIVYLGHVSVSEAGTHGHQAVRDYMGPGPTVRRDRPALRSRRVADRGCSPAAGEARPAHRHLHGPGSRRAGVDQPQGIPRADDQAPRRPHPAGADRLRTAGKNSSAAEHGRPSDGRLHRGRALPGPEPAGARPEPLHALPGVRQGLCRVARRRDALDPRRQPLRRIPGAQRLPLVS